MSVLEGLLQAIVETPREEDLYCVLADWLEEHDDPRRAELLRLHRRLQATCCEPDLHPERTGWQSRLVELVGQGARPCVPRQTVVLDSGVEMLFSFIPPGSFLMGSPEDEEDRESCEFRHQVTIERGFWLSCCQVTQAQWQAVMGTNPSKFKGEDRPVETVAWQECQTFCDQARHKTGKRFRLPAEAEWEFACRAGTTGLYCSGNDLEALRQVGWCSPNDKWNVGGETKPVARLLPNALGLYDMHGNVLEWCQEWLLPYPEPEEEMRRWGENRSVRMLRGGSWLDPPSWCRSAFRGWREPDRPGSNFGFRACLDLD